MRHELFNKVYCSETGNWIGRCMKCGIDLIIWTGAKGTLPEQHFISARRYHHGEIKICNYRPCPGPRHETKGVPLRSSYFNTPINLGDSPRSVRQAWGRPWHMQKEGCCLYYYWGSMQRPHSIVKFIDGSADSIWSDATRGLITRTRGD